MEFSKLLNPFCGIEIIIKNRDLLWQLTKRNIMSRYKGSALGVFWSFIQPLMMLCVYTFVFGVVFKARWGVDMGGGKSGFAVIMFCGMAVFNIFGESANGSSNLIIGNPNFVKKVIFPLEVLPLAHVASVSILSLAWFILLFIGAIVFFNSLSWTMLLLPVTLLPVILIACGASFFISSFTVYLRDAGHLVAVITQIMFFMTPIFYPLQAVPEKLRFILQLNPLALIVEQTRRLFLYGNIPDWKICGLALLASIAIFQFGLAWFMKTKKGFADVL